MFDLSTVKATGTQDVLPAGAYDVAATNAEVKETKNGTGKYIQVEFKVKSGEHEGRKLWTNFNVENSNPQAVTIGLGQLKAFLIAAKYPNPEKLSSVTDICGLSVTVKTKIKTDDVYGDKAEVSYFKETKAPSQVLEQKIAF
jgi:hypothetical protein